LIRWLKSEATKRPTRIDTPPHESSAGAHVQPAFAAGSMTLQRGDQLVSLVWSAKDKDRRRALTAGTYALRTTRLEREKEGAWWFLSSTGPAVGEIQVTQRAPTKLTIDDVVVFEGNAKLHGKKLQLGFSITGSDKRGLSIYKNGKRVPVTYKVKNRKGRVLARGQMNYG